MTRDAPDFKPKDRPDAPRESPTARASRSGSSQVARCGNRRDKQTGEPLAEMQVSPWDVPKELGDFRQPTQGVFSITGFSPSTGPPVWTAPPPGSHHFMAMAAVPEHGAW